jgi:hypothetical protein
VRNEKDLICPNILVILILFCTTCFVLLDIQAIEKPYSFFPVSKLIIAVVLPILFITYLFMSMITKQKVGLKSEKVYPSSINYFIGIWSLIFYLKIVLIEPPSLLIIIVSSVLLAGIVMILYHDGFWRDKLTSTDVE